MSGGWSSAVFAGQVDSAEAIEGIDGAGCCCLAFLLFPFATPAAVLLAAAPEDGSGRTTSDDSDPVVGSPNWDMDKDTAITELLVEPAAAAAVAALAPELEMSCAIARRAETDTFPEDDVTDGLSWLPLFLPNVV
ncbi:hypothetical protein BCR44DRAFT_1439039 [Catenaria anguillulae PL171]|uniref:Uncharacterized protein n=1 Tax=Catenaria anguillulae PL171 TaxID=765915 RepID=A0A1Y2HEU2_9FUNG|nr:hypothetical protein BCR44DRAFT_1439039 [Catenaria anguillulae PL171]